MKASQFNRLRRILKQWYAKERRIEKLEYDAMDANNEVWRMYHMQVSSINHHIRRMYLMYPDALFSHSGPNAINDWLKD